MAQIRHEILLFVIVKGWIGFKKTGELAHRFFSQFSKMSLGPPHDVTLPRKIPNPEVIESPRLFSTSSTALSVGELWLKSLEPLQLFSLSVKGLVVEIGPIFICLIAILPKYLVVSLFGIYEIYSYCCFHLMTYLLQSFWYGEFLLRYHDALFARQLWFTANNFTTLVNIWAKFPNNFVRKLHVFSAMHFL